MIFKIEKGTNLITYQNAIGYKREESSLDVYFEEEDVLFGWIASGLITSIEVNVLRRYLKDTPDTIYQMYTGFNLPQNVFNIQYIIARNTDIECTEKSHVDNDLQTLRKLRQQDKDYQFPGQYRYIFK